MKYFYISNNPFTFAGMTLKKIYALRNPLENEVIFYVGQSKDPFKRLLNHMRDSLLDKYPYHKTILEICKQGKMPIVEILEEITYNTELNQCRNADHVCQREKFWIKQYANQLKNIAHNEFGKLVAKSRKCNRCGNEYCYQKESSKFCSTECRVYSRREKSAFEKENKADKKLAEDLANDPEVDKILEEINNLPPDEQKHAKIPITYDEWILSAKNHKGDATGFKMSLTKSKMTPGQKGMILSKLPKT